MPVKITRRRTLQAAAGAATALIAPRGNADTVKTRPNVLFIFDDQLRAQACPLYGGKNVPMPYLDRLAREGLTFNNAIATCPLCTPYRGMLQTGRYPTHTGVVVNFVDIHPSSDTLAHVFKRAGYRTAFIGKWHLYAGRRRQSGKHNAGKEDQARVARAEAAFIKENPESEFVPPGPLRLGYDFWRAYNFHTAFAKYWFYEDRPEKIFSGKYEADTIIDQTIDFMRRQKAAGEPFFAVVAPHPPHPPFTPAAAPPGYLEKIPNELNWAPNVPREHPHRKDPTRARCYYSMIRSVDDNLGRLLDFLDQSGLTENTLVVFTADHGEMLGSQGRENKMVPYAESVNLPLVMRWPHRIAPDRRIDILQTPVDYLPTLCGLAGITPPSGLDGKDLSANVLGRDEAGRDAVLMANYVSDWDFFDSGTSWPEWRGVRTLSHTYVKWLSGKEELYDNQNDRYQMKNLAENQADLPTMKKLRGRLKDLLAEAHDEFLPGTAYADWYDDHRQLIKTATGPA